MQKDGKWKIIGVIGVLVAIISVFITAFIYLETTRPQSQSEQIKDKLDITEKRWHEAKKLVEEENRGENVDRLKGMLQEARELYLDAENKWMHGNYDGAKTSVDESYEITMNVIEQIVLVVPMFWLAAVLLVITAIILAAIVILRERL